MNSVTVNGVVEALRAALNSEMITPDDRAYDEALAVSTAASTVGRPLSTTARHRLGAFAAQMELVQYQTLASTLATDESSPRAPS